MGDATDLLPCPTQPDGVAWPTDAWPEAPLDARVDRVALDALLDHAFARPEPDDLQRTHAAVVVQRGAIVAERYADGVSPDDAFLSWSIAKSITNALVGILVRQGRLDVSRPIPVKEWPDGDPRQRITIDQMLRMVDGLRFREAEDLGNGSVRYYPLEESDVIPMLFGEGKPDVAGFAATLPKVAEPETRWNYNSGGSNLLARFVGDVVSDGARDAGERASERCGASCSASSSGRSAWRSGRPALRRGRELRRARAHCYCEQRATSRASVYLYLRDGDLGRTARSCPRAGSTTRARRVRCRVGATVPTSG